MRAMLWLLALMSAGCTIEHRVQSAHDACIANGGAQDECRRVAIERQRQLDGWRAEGPRALEGLHLDKAGSETAPKRVTADPSTMETAPDGTKWYTRTCYCPIATCQLEVHKDCPGPFEVEGQDPSRPLEEYSVVRQRVGYQLKYRCLAAPAQR